VEQIKEPNPSSGKGRKEEILLWLVGFEVFAAEVMNVAIFWDIARNECIYVM
jgi:hypothetical protein